MEKHQDFTQWVLRQGAKLHGIAPHRFPSHGLGIVAKEKHKAGEIILEIPAKALRTEHTVSRTIKSKLGEITVHGLLAADLSLNTRATNPSWRAVLPTKDDFSESMPFMWEESLQKLLPPGGKSLLENQERKFKLDWAATSKAYPELSVDTYIYHWLIVNTRTFYYVRPRSKKPKLRDDCMALNPFADYFNHADRGCLVEFGPEGYVITTDQVYEKGDEIYISYGNHSNDFLLAEYGFILPQNKYDHVLLDHVILPEMTSQQRKALEEAGYWGNYSLSGGVVCHRTQVALRQICLPLKAWNRFVTGEDDGETDQSKVDRVLIHFLTKFEQQATQNLKNIRKNRNRSDSQLDLLDRRWQQILNLLSEALKRVQA